MTFSDLSNEMRRKFTINNSVTAGVVISAVEPRSPAAAKQLQPGEILVEIDQQPIKQPTQAASKLADLKTAGQRSALLLVENAQGEVRFVALPVE